MLNNRKRFPDMTFPTLLCEADEMLSRQLYQVGPATGTGFGLAPVSWVELRAWDAAMKNDLAPFQAESLMLMSRSYTGEFNDVGREGASTRPFETEEDTRSRQQQVAHALKIGLGGMAKRK